MSNYPHQPYGQPPYGQQYPQQYQQPYGMGGAPLVAESGAERLAFIKKVYALFSGSVLLSAVGAMVALNVGTPVVVEGVAVPPLVALFGSMHWLLRIGLFFGAVFGASAVRRVPRVNVAALFGMAFFIGLWLAPLLFLVTLSASDGGTLSANPVRDAFLLAVVMFGGLTGYVTLSKKDFSYLGSALTMGLFVIIGASVLNLFVGSNAFSLAISSVGLILFGGYVLYDTSRILKAEDRDAVGGALQIYLDFVNIFLYLLRILGSRR